MYRNTVAVAVTVIRIKITESESWKATEKLAGLQQGKNLNNGLGKAIIFLRTIRFLNIGIFESAKFGSCFRTNHSFL